ncbi:diguanylate cyclase [Glaciecola siphonariae]|uniref:diguanylate cyclase n=1 Tax=Glaciecola siphonariae TaxID=521012 RepID=A0ABV9LXM5_9ALTE
MTAPSTAATAVSCTLKALALRASASFLPLIALMVLATTGAAIAQTQTHVDEQSPANALTQNFQSEEAVINGLARLTENGELPPEQIVKRLTALQALSEQNSWQQAYLEVTLEKANFLFNIDAKTEAKNTLESLLTKVDIESVNNSVLVQAKIQMLELSISDALGEVMQNENKREALLNLAPLIEDNGVLGDMYLALAHSHFDAENFIDAIELLKLAYDKFEIIENNLGLGSVLSTLGNINIALGNTEEGLKSFEQAIGFARRANNTYTESIIQYNIATAYYDLEDYQAAEQSIEQTLVMNKALNDEIGVAWSESLRARIFLRQGRWQASADVTEKIVPIFYDAGLHLMHVQSLIDLTHAYIELGKLEQAQTTLDQANEYRIKLNLNNINQRYKRQQSKLAFAKENYQEAYTLLEEVIDIQADEFRKAEVEQIQRYKIEFDSDLKDRQNEALQRENALNVELISQQKQLEQVWLALSIASLLLFAILAYILFKQIQKRNRYKELAHIDLLTKAPNRRSILYMAKQKFETADKNGFCIALLDIDNFKQINDTYGHEVGDEVLIAFAKACEQAIRHHDKFGRYGGEEWLLAFDAARAESMQDVFERIRAKLQLLIPSCVPDSLEITFSMGVANYSADTDKNLNQMIVRADNLLYQAKHQGKDQLVIDLQQ